MIITPAEHFLLLIAFQATRSDHFDIQTIRDCLDVASSKALLANDSEEFRLLLEQIVEESPTDSKIDSKELIDDSLQLRSPESGNGNQALHIASHPL